MAESREDLQVRLNIFGEYCQKWKLKVNVEKNKIFIFSRVRPLEDIHFSLNGSEIEIVNEFNYLGIQAMYEVLKRGRTHSLSVECQLELFDKMVKPMLLYGSEMGI